MAAAAGASGDKPSVLVLGGMGMIGRNLVKYLVDNKLASYIRVADKRIARFADLSAEHTAALNADVVETVQVDLATEEGADAAFLTADGTTFSVVFNLAAETKSGLPDARYRQMIDIARLTATQAIATCASKYILVSTAQVYKSDKTPSAETGDTKPWTKHAAVALEAEDVIQKMAELPWVIARPAVVYGPGDERGLMPRCVCALAYVRSGDPMKFLWDDSLRCDTVHVFDTVRALWLLAARAPTGPGSVWNIASPEPTDQGKLAAVLSSVFGIETGFYGTIISNMARLKMSAAVQDANDSHMLPWLEALRECSIGTTPLSPFIHEELLYSNHLAVDGSRLVRELGFSYKVPELTAPAIKDMISRAIVQGIFPHHVGDKDLGLGAPVAAAAASSSSSS